ncbi:hypothetical protein [Actinopolymorpha alba]|uniref:hypothetical protein n=1 Tax=Actinopolymorpha alba TaxID=533267 RepID=UPI00192C67B9|nr:hypothetical protein [Actinopolymorpha alba]
MKVLGTGTIYTGVLTLHLTARDMQEADLPDLACFYSQLGLQKMPGELERASSHRGKKAIERLAKRFPNAVMVHTPVHASWLNQVEVYFSVVQHKVVSPNDFTDLAEVENRLLAFEKRYNATAKPFRWKFTKNDLDDLLTRIDQHQTAGVVVAPAASARDVGCGFDEFVVDGVGSAWSSSLPSSDVMRRWPTRSGRTSPCLMNLGRSLRSSL